MPKENASDRPKIYFTSRGERYIDGGELLRSKKGRKVIKEMTAFSQKYAKATTKKSR